MTVTNSLYKPNNGESPDVDVLVSTNSFILNNTLNLLLDGATATSQYGYLTYPKNSNTVDAANTTVDPNVPPDVTGGNWIYFCDYYDTFSDASVDTNRWVSAGTGGTTTELDGYMLIDTAFGESRTVTSSGTTPFDLMALSGNVEFVIACSASNGLIQITNGSTTVTIATVDVGTSGQAYYRFVFNSLTDLIYVWKDGAYIESKDVSTVTTNKYIRFNNPDTDNFKIYYVGYAASGITGTNTWCIQFTTSATSPIQLNYKTEVGTLTPTISGNGSTFDVATNNILNNVSTSGTTHKVKFSATNVTTINATSSDRNIPTLKFSNLYYS